MPPPQPAETGRHARRRSWRRALGLAGVLAGICAAAAGWYAATRFDPFGSAQAAYDRRDLGTALSAARAFLARRPHDPRASLLAARCYQRLGETPRAEAAYRDADPQSLTPDDRHARAVGLIRLDRPAEAASTYEEILKQNPGDALALRRLGSVAIGRKRWGEVLRVAARLEKVPGSEVAGLTMRAVALHEGRHYADAAKAARRVLDLDPGLNAMPLPKPLFWRNYATDLLAQGETEAARAALDRALAGGEDAALVELLGRSYQLDNQPEKAEACWLRALALDESFVDTWLDLGQLALRRKQWGEASERLARAVRLDPARMESHFSLGQALRGLGRTAEADAETAEAARLRKLKDSAGAAR